MLPMVLSSHILTMGLPAGQNSNQESTAALPKDGQCSELRIKRNIELGGEVRRKAATVQRQELDGMMCDCKSGRITLEKSRFRAPRAVIPATWNRL